MSNKKRNLRLLGVLAILIVVSMVLGFSGSDGSSYNIDKRIFAVDPNTVISDVVLKRQQDELRFSYTDQQWVVNNKFLMDIRIRDTFFGILSALEVRRPVAGNQRDSIAGWLAENGVGVEVSYVDEPVKSYTIGGDEERGVTYVMGDDREPYIARLPGFQNYIAGIFSVPELDWKNRAVFNTDWLSMGGLTWDYVDEEKDDIEFVPGDPLFTIENLPNIDSTRAMNYLEEIVFLQVDRFILSEEADQYRTAPYLMCTLNDRQLGDQTMVVYEPNEGQPLTLVEINGKEYGLMRWSRISGYFLEPADLTTPPSS